MPYKEKIKKIAKNFPGLIEPTRLELLNIQLIELKKKGYSKIIDNFLSNKNLYTIRPFLFEIYICRWLLAQDQCCDIEYEPVDIAKPPEFTFKIKNKLFQIEAKAITQLNNETVKKKLVSQINRRISTLTNKVLEIWLSENIDPKDINTIVEWISVECVTLSIGNKKEYKTEDETIAWIKAIAENETGGIVGVEFYLGTANGLAQKIDVTNIREKILSKIKKANSKFKLRQGKYSYNFVFLTCDSNIFITKETFQEALYGSEAIISYPDKDGKYQFKEVLQNNGIWSKEIYTNIDSIMFIKPGTDLLGNEFDPFIFPNPYAREKLQKIPEPFRDMKTHIPPTLLG